MEITANAVQIVTSGGNVLFTNTPVKGSCSIIHREGSGLVTLRGQNATQTRARFLVYFGGNIAIPTGGTVEAISVSIAVNGEPVPTSQAIVTPAAVSNYFNVSCEIYLDVPKCCCYQISVQNTSDESIAVQNANLIVERVA